MKKWLLGVPLVLIAVFIWLPLWMLISGTFMGGAEVSENLAPVLESRGGMAVWPVIARYPTLAAYVELLLDTPQFFSVFWNSCGQVFPIILGHVLLGAPAAWAFAKFHFRGKKILYTLYIVLMLMPFQVTMVSSYLVLNKLGLIDTVWAVILPGAASTLPVFIMTRFFYGHTGGGHGGGSRGWGILISDIFTIWTSAWRAGNPVGCGIGFFGILECNRGASGIFKKPDALAAFIVYVKHHSG